MKRAFSYLIGMILVIGLLGWSFYHMEQLSTSAIEQEISYTHKEDSK